MSPGDQICLKYFVEGTKMSQNKTHVIPDCICIKDKVIDDFFWQAGLQFGFLLWLKRDCKGCQILVYTHTSVWGRETIHLEMGQCNCLL